MWLLSIDVSVVYIYLVSFMDFLNDIHDEFVKQDVWLHDNFRVYFKNPRTKKLVKLYEDTYVEFMWGLI